MAVAAVAAARYTPSWFDPDEGCALWGRCPGPTTAAALQALWVVEWAGLAVVGLGLVLTWRRLRGAPSTPPPHPLPAWAQAAAGALVGMVLCVVLGWVVLVAALLSAPAVPAGLCLAWLVQAAAVSALDRHVGPAHRSALSAWVTGLVISALGVAAVAGWAVATDAARALPVVDGAVLAVGLLVRRAAARRAGRAPVGVRQWSAAGAVYGVAAVAAAVLVVGAGTGSATDRGTPADVVVPDRPPPAPAPRRVPTTPDPVPGAVDASVPCTARDLSWSTTGWDAAMGTRAVTVVATSRATGPCYLDGVPEVVISQGGRPLRLTMVPGSTTGVELPAPRRVGLAVGGAAAFPLEWKGYGAAADADTPQQLTVTLPDTAGSSPVPLEGGAAPFDLVDGGTVEIGPWGPSAPG